MSSPRVAYRTDSNQAEIVAAYRAAGASVFVTAGLGDGFPDLVVGIDGRNFLIEVKRPGRLMTVEECRFAGAWCGQYAVVSTIESALKIIGR